ncbi:MAG: efflux RND transporter periplasmic adaptor subunit [Silvanigrellaceae bacterium]|nr:efflux RND transporter periplasmic adaptor subunit [Silvanigrellaceae bacterium]
MSFNVSFVLLPFFLLLLNSACKNDTYDLPQSLATVTPLPLPSQSPTAPKQIEKKNEEETNHLFFSGTIIATRQSILSFKMSGHIDTIQVKTGDIVTKGQLVVQLDEREAQLNEKTARVVNSSKQLALSQAKKELARTKEQFEHHVIPLSQFEKVQNAFSTTELEAAQASLELEKKKNNLLFAKMLAPYDGMITQTFKNEKDFVNIGEQVLKIVDIYSIESQIKFPESYLNKIKIGTLFKFNSPAKNKDNFGTLEIIRIVNVVDSKTRTFDAFAKIKQFDATLVPGEFIELKL